MAALYQAFNGQWYTTDPNAFREAVTLRKTLSFSYLPRILARSHTLYSGLPTGANGHIALR